MQKWKQTKVMPKELEEPDFPSIIGYIWTWFGELNDARPRMGFGLSPISYSDIYAWAELTGAKPTPWEVSLLKAIDSVFLSINSASKKGKT